MPVKTQVLQYNLTRNLMFVSFLSNKKDENMVAISRQYPFGADKAVQIKQAVCFCYKGTNRTFEFCKLFESGPVVQEEMQLKDISYLELW